MAFNFHRLFEGAIGNYSEVNIDDLYEEYGMYLMEDEEIEIGFKLIRDALIFTDKRIIMTDQQGATGMKMTVESINLYSIVNVKMETSGFGFDDSQLTFTYISSPDLKCRPPEYCSRALEFPKHYDVQTVYLTLQELAYNNCLRLNGLD